MGFVQNWFDKGVDVYICINPECPKFRNRNQPEGRMVSNLEKTAADIGGPPVCPVCQKPMGKSL